MQLPNFRHHLISHFCWGEGLKQCKHMVILRDFPLVHCLVGDTMTPAFEHLPVDFDS